MRAVRPLFLPQNLDLAQDLLAVLRDVADHHGATPSQAALAWVIGHPNVIAIPGASSVNQLESNVAAADLQLTDDEVGRLEEAVERFRPLMGIGAVPALARTLLP